jgi:hypothetical protein
MLLLASSYLHFFIAVYVYQYQGKKTHFLLVDFILGIQLSVFCNVVNSYGC